MKKPLILLFTCVFLLGCNRILNSSTATERIITPSIGILDVITLGMPKNEIAKKTNDLHSNDLTNIGWLNLWVPSLGVEWEQEKDDVGPRALSFHVSSDALSCVPNKYRMSRFAGRVAGGPSFEVDGGVRRPDIVACFGEPLHSISNAVILKEDADVMAEWARRSEPYSILNVKTHAETIVYPNKGVSFALHSNVVNVVNVFGIPGAGPTGSGRKKSGWGSSIKE